eukprot:2990382-Rhodomonas_salina.2
MSTNPDYDLSYWEIQRHIQYHCRAQVFDVTGAKLGTEFQVNTDVYGRDWNPVVTGFGADRFLIQWADSMGTEVGQFF